MRFSRFLGAASYFEKIIACLTGTITHAETPWKSFAQIFEFFESGERIVDFVSGLQKDEKKRTTMGGKEAEGGINVRES